MMRTQGTLTKQSFDVDTSDLAVEFTLNTDISSPSTAYLSSDYYYENGLTYTFTTSEGIELPDSSVTAEYTENILSFTISDDSLNSSTIKLTVAKK